MTRLKQLSENWGRVNRSLTVEGEGAFSSEEAFVCGFIIARELAAQKADSWRPDDTDGALGKAIREIGAEPSWA